MTRIFCANVGILNSIDFYANRAKKRKTFVKIVPYFISSFLKFYLLILLKLCVTYVLAFQNVVTPKNIWVHIFFSLQFFQIKFFQKFECMMVFTDFEAFELMENIWFKLNIAESWIFYPELHWSSLNSWQKCYIQ